MIRLAVLANCPECTMPFLLEILSQEFVGDRQETTAQVVVSTYPLDEHRHTSHGKLGDDRDLARGPR